MSAVAVKLKKLAIVALIITALLIFAWSLMIWMPGKSYQQALPALSQAEINLQDRLKRDVETLTAIGSRNAANYQNLIAAEAFLDRELSQVGYVVRSQQYTVDGKTFSNLEVEIPGSTLANQILVIGGHYDSGRALDPNDRATGAAAVLALAREFVGTKPLRTLRFVEFTNQELPYSQTQMGSVVYAQAAKQRGDRIVGMFSLDRLGDFTTANTQRYPFPLNLLYPHQGNFIGFVSNIDSRELLRNTLRSFRAQAKFPSEGIALPSGIQGTISSDSWAFWQQDYQAVTITDTGSFRTPADLSKHEQLDKIDFDRLSRVTYELSKVIRDFVGLEG
jgi:Peptidase family M28